MNWIQSKVADLPITNFTTDWNDGKAVGALVDAVAPGLCPDWQVSFPFIFYVFGIAILSTIKDPIISNISTFIFQTVSCVFQIKFEILLIM